MTTNSPWLAGYRAYFDGYVPQDNPYEHAEDYSEWYDGWEAGMCDAIDSEEWYED